MCFAGQMSVGRTAGGEVRVENLYPSLAPWPRPAHAAPLSWPTTVVAERGPDAIAGMGRKVSVHHRFADDSALQVEGESPPCQRARR